VSNEKNNKLTRWDNGRDFRVTDVYESAVDQLIA